MNSNECCPFILRFSKSMIRKNPRMVMVGKIRTHPQGTPDPEKICESLINGINFYHGFSYNRSLPTFNRLSLKKGSGSKSLRYRFLSVTGIKPVASLSVNDLIFSIGSGEQLEKINRAIAFSKDASFAASFSHISEIEAFMPEDKLSLSFSFTEKMKNMHGGNPFYICLFPQKDSAETIIPFLKNELGAENISPVKVEDRTILRATCRDIKSRLDLLLTHSLVRSVKPESCLLLEPAYIRHEELPAECVSLRDPAFSYPKAAVIDSGLAENSFLKEWELKTVKMTKKQTDPGHGTFVAGRLLTDGEKFGGITFLNVEILSGGQLRLDVFYNKMRSLLMEYAGTIKIYNISLSSHEIISKEEYSEAAHMLDSLQYEFDVLFIISAGNCKIIRQGENHFFDEDIITSPAESIHSITVGSAAHTDTNLQLKDTPSFFTRRGPAAGGTIKPELCAYGGAHETRMGKTRPVGVFSIGTRNELAEDTGTSHAVPRVSAVAAKIYHKYSHAFKSPDMTKAIILHYTHLKNSRKPDAYTGYGVLPEESDSFENMPDSVVFLHSGTVGHGNIVEVPDIPVPELLFENGKASGSICLTLVYKTKTDMNFSHLYTCSALEVSLGYYKNAGWISILTSKDMLTTGCGTEKPEILKWHPARMFEKDLKKCRIPEKLFLRISPLRRDFYEKKFQINYSVVLSFTQKNKNLFRFMENNYISYNGAIEPASEMWKNC